MENFGDDGHFPRISIENLSKICDVHGMTFPGINQTNTEGDVETQIVVPLLTEPEFLGHETQTIKSKEFLAAFDIGKGAKARKGYVPDYCVYLLSLPILAIEVKAPTVPVGDAWEEASLYAHAMNRRFKSELNPCSFVFATNGLDFCAGRWDNAAPIVSGKVADLVVGSAILSKLQNLIGSDVLVRFAGIASASVKLVNFKRPFNQGDGPALINSKLDANTFAADLSPILRRYFSSRDQNRDPEIYKKAYVSSSEITSYDKVLEAFLVDRLSRSRNRTQIQTTKRRADEVSKTIAGLTKEKPQSGELQLITGGVGTGKSLFARRYKEFLQSNELKNETVWSFIDFNFAEEISTELICAAFARSIIEEGAEIDLRDEVTQERVFSEQLADRSAYYARIERSNPGRGELERARDIEGWRQDPIQLAIGLANYVHNVLGKILIVVFDNVDRRDGRSELETFERALWFMNAMNCLVLLQMRDVTFEIHKNERPLDTYKTGKIFHISPPKFIDVVKRRLELSLADLATQAPETIRYKTPSGVTITYPKSRAGEFLKGVYLELFQRPNNTSRILEALAGRDVRRALDMFMAIITSGHMPEDLITSVAVGTDVSHFPEYLVIRILMRQDYRFFSDNSGFVSNIFHCDSRWERPSNLLVPEALFYLISQRRVTGENNQLGFVAISRLQIELERLGFVRNDVFSAAQYLLDRDLVEADSATAKTLDDADSIRPTAAGWAHMRILVNRVEYLGAVLLTTRINDAALQARIFDLMMNEVRFGKLYRNQVAQVVEHFAKYLESQHQILRSHPGYLSPGKNGSAYVLAKMREALQFDKAEAGPVQTEMDWLDA